VIFSSEEKEERGGLKFSRSWTKEEGCNFGKGRVRIGFRKRVKKKEEDRNYVRDLENDNQKEERKSSLFKCSIETVLPKVERKFRISVGLFYC